MDLIQRNMLSIKNLFFNFLDQLIYSFHILNPFKRVKCPSDATIDGKTVLITGATQGIGRSTAIALAKRGAKLILACRNMNQSNQLAQEIEKITGNKVITVHLDLVSLQSVRRCAEQVLQSVDRLDILINNAGIAGAPTREVTIDGFEKVMQVNHIGPFLLTKLLLPLVKPNSSSRIIFTASSLHRMLYKFDLDNLNSDKYYNFRIAYAKSKLANILTTLYLSSLLKDSGITVNSFCPGPVGTNLADDLTGPVFSMILKPFNVIISRTPDEGAQTLIYLAVEKSLESVTGLHFVDCEPRKPSFLACDFNLATKLWEITEKLLEAHLK